MAKTKATDPSLNKAHQGDLFNCFVSHNKINTKQEDIKDFSNNAPQINKAKTTKNKINHHSSKKAQDLQPCTRQLSIIDDKLEKSNLPILGALFDDHNHHKSLPLLVSQDHVDKDSDNISKSLDQGKDSIHNISNHQADKKNDQDYNNASLCLDSDINGLLVQCNSNKSTKDKRSSAKAQLNICKKESSTGSLDNINLCFNGNDEEKFDLKAQSLSELKKLDTNKKEIEEPLSKAKQQSLFSKDYIVGQCGLFDKINDQVLKDEYNDHKLVYVSLKQISLQEEFSDVLAPSENLPDIGEDDSNEDIYALAEPAFKF